MAKQSKDKVNPRHDRPVEQAYNFEMIPCDDHIHIVIDDLFERTLSPADALQVANRAERAATVVLDYEAGLA